MSDGTNSSLTKGILLGFVGLAVIIAVVSYFRSGYGDVSYPTYQAATALYGACLARSEARIDLVETLIANGNEKFDADLLSAQERSWLESVIRAARGGEWESAAAMAKRMMEDQVSLNDG